MVLKAGIICEGLEKIMNKTVITHRIYRLKFEEHV
jgi:hypothetical protein